MSSSSSSSSNNMSQLSISSGGSNSKYTIGFEHGEIYVCIDLSVPICLLKNTGALGVSDNADGGFAVVICSLRDTVTDRKNRQLVVLAQVPDSFDRNLLRSMSERNKLRQIIWEQVKSFMLPHSRASLDKLYTLFQEAEPKTKAVVPPVSSAKVVVTNNNDRQQQSQTQMEQAIKESNEAYSLQLEEQAMIDEALALSEHQARQEAKQLEQQKAIMRLSMTQHKSSRPPMKHQSMSSSASFDYVDEEEEQITSSIEEEDEQLSSSSMFARQRPSQTLSRPTSSRLSSRPVEKRVQKHDFSDDEVQELPSSSSSSLSSSLSSSASRKSVMTKSINRPTGSLGSKPQFKSKFCPQCGAGFEPKHKFCYECGEARV